MDHQEIADKIVGVFSEDLSKPEQELIKKIPQGLTAESPIVIGFIGPLILRSSINKLSENIKEADKSSGNLTKAIVLFTSIGTVIAGTGLIIQALNFFKTESSAKILCLSLGFLILCVIAFRIYKSTSK